MPRQSPRKCVSYERERRRRKGEGGDEPGDRGPENLRTYDRNTNGGRERFYSSFRDPSSVGIRSGRDDDNDDDDVLLAHSSPATFARLADGAVSSLSLSSLFLAGSRARGTAAREILSAPIKTSLIYRLYTYLRCLVIRLRSLVLSPSLFYASLRFPRFSRGRLAYVPSQAPCLRRPSRRLSVSGAFDVSRQRLFGLSSSTTWHSTPSDLWIPSRRRVSPALLILGRYPRV